MPINPERLAQVGPPDPRTGFPLWYEDGTGTRLELAWQSGDPLAPVVIDPAESGTLRGITDFPGESFYMSAEARIPLGGGDRKAFAQVILALETTFATGRVEDGQQIVFGRTRFRVRGGRTHSAYTLTHPYGTVEVTTDDRGRASDTQDIGVAPLGFADALGWRIAPFLRWSSDPALPAGYLGDGATDHTITGSPFGTDFALVEGPGTLPARATVTNLTDAVALPVTVEPTDAVEITHADYDGSARTLTVGATSSDRQGPATLTVTDGGAVLGPPGTFSLDAPPAAVTVRSSVGGTNTANVRVSA